jgi:hypothetical protein
MPGYDLNTESIHSFVEDGQIKLPRFQRKLTWSDEDKFELCLSVFKGYPIGVIVLSEEGSDKYLLDGRQRRNALDQMNNPENIYDWAKSAIGFNIKDSEDEVREQYWEFVDEYFGQSDARETTETDGDEESEESEASDEDEESETTGSGSSRYAEDQSIKDLLDIVLTVHKKRGKTSGLTKPLDFKQYIEGLDYITTDSSGRRYVDTDQLIDWIEYNSNSGRTPRIETFTQDDLYEWLMKRKQPGGENAQEETIRKHVDRRWDSILDVFRALRTLNTTLGNRRLGYMQVRDVTANDEKKIFEIINDRGTQLEAVEILSAKPSYNIELENPSERLREDIEYIYTEEMGVERTDAVRWDRPATFYRRLSVDTIIQPDRYKFEKRVRTGFKLMSGYYLHGVSRDHFGELSYEDDIAWGSTDLEDAMNEMEEKLTTHELLKFWQAWGDSLTRMTSEAVGINYLLCMMALWEELGKPTTTSSAAFKQFQNKGVVLFDRMLYEYVTRLWRGSSDSLIAQNLDEVTGSHAMFDPVPQDTWRSVLEELVEDGRIEGRSQLTNKNPTRETKAILRYYYVLRGMKPSATGTMSLDHIIPKRKFESATQDEIKQKKHHVANLAEFPKQDNTEKGTKTLTQIDNDWLKQQIAEYAGIDESDFPKYTDASDVDELIENRGERIVETFIDARSNRLDIV